MRMDECAGNETVTLSMEIHTFRPCDTLPEEARSSPHFGHCVILSTPRGQLHVPVSLASVVRIAPAVQAYVNSTTICTKGNGSFLARPYDGAVSHFRRFRGSRGSRSWHYVTRMG